MADINITVAEPAIVTVSPAINLNPVVGVIPRAEQLLAEVQQLADDFGLQVVQANTQFEFPNLGKENCVYIDQTNNKTYRWSDSDLKYYCIGSDYTQIETVNGGTANE